MPHRKTRLRIIFLHIITLPILYFAFTFFTLGPKPYTGVDEAVVEKIAKEHGRMPQRPFLDPGEGDLLLFAFLIAGVIGGFAAGYYWRVLIEKKPEKRQ